MGDGVIEELDDLADDLLIEDGLEGDELHTPAWDSIDDDEEVLADLADDGSELDESDEESGSDQPTADWSGA